MVEKNEISCPTNNLDTWTAGVLSNMKRMSTDEAYRQHIALLVRGDAEAWEIRQNETDNQASRLTAIIRP